MKTDDLIRTLAADTSREPDLERRLVPALGAGGLVTLAGFLFFFGPRADLLAADQYLDVILKPALGLALGLGGLGAVMAAARPGAEIGAWKWPLLAAPALAILVVLVELALLPSPLWKPAFLGDSIAMCLTGIPLLGLPLLAATLAALRHGASTDPRRTGALAGLLSGGLAAVVYSFYCIEDSALFYTVWYSVGILGLTGLGAALGSRVLRW